MNGGFHLPHDLPYDDEIFVKNISAWAKAAADEAYFCRYTMFLSERKAALASYVLGGMGFDGYAFYGGYDDAQRTVLSVFGDALRPKLCDYPIEAVSFRYKPCYKLTHRDFLGVLMSLEIKRECIGDIVIGEGACVVFIAPQVLDDVLAIDKVGRIGVTAEKGREALDEIDLSQSVTLLSGTVGSMRLDCIIAFAANVSRSRAQELIKAKLVTIGGVHRDSESYRVSVGDVFTVRGYGKFVLTDQGGKTRKDRIHIEIKKYV